MSNTRDAWTAAVTKKAPLGKYGSKKKMVDGITFDSSREAARYCELKFRQKAGEIHRLAVQPGFPLAVWSNKDSTLPVKLGEYRADFIYCECHSQGCDWSQQRIEDVKGHDTPLSRWKRKHAEAQFGITIRIVK